MTKCCSSLGKQHRLQLAYEALPVCCSPALICERPGLWPELCLALQLAADKVISHHLSSIIAACTIDYSHSATSVKVVIEVCRVGGTLIYPAIIKYLVEQLDNPQLLDVTEEDYAIYETPDDKLYHQNLVDEAFELNLETKNVKKTSKVYSHKEQVIMLEEKKAEIQRKRKEGKLELTGKQKEVKKMQMEKESAIREKVSLIVSNVPNNLSLLEAVVEGANPSMLPSVGPLVQLLVSYFKSTIVGSTYALLYPKLGNSIMDDKYSKFRALVGRVTPRVLGADEAYLPFDWLQDYETADALRTLDAMHELTVPDSSTILEDDDGKYLTAPEFVYCFPLLQWMLNNIKKLVYDEDSDTEEEDAELDDEAEEKVSKLEHVHEKESDTIISMSLQVSLQFLLLRMHSQSYLFCPFQINILASKRHSTYIISSR